jgi:hypothetical protein
MRAMTELRQNVSSVYIVVKALKALHTIEIV